MKVVVPSEKEEKKGRKKERHHPHLSFIHPAVTKLHAKWEIRRKSPKDRRPPQRWPFGIERKRQT
jgi:hypothetical protein